MQELVLSNMFSGIELEADYKGKIRHHNSHMADTQMLPARLNDVTY